MRLTENQEQYISRYVNAVADALAERLNEQQRDRALSRLNTRIMELINGTGKARIEDADVLDTLRKMGAPETQANILVRVWSGSEAAPNINDIPLANTLAQSETATRSEIETPNTKKAAPKPYHRTTGNKSLAPAVLLGVLAWLAEQLDWPAWALRALAVVVGVVTIPIALPAYMGVYFWLRFNGRLSPVPPLRWWQMIFRPTIMALMLCIIHFTGVYAVKAIYFAHATWLKREMPDINEWAWFESESGRMFFWALLLLLPLALFSAMPLANAWDYSLKRFTQACAALYAIVVSFGVASFVTGIILAFVREFTGS